VAEVEWTLYEHEFADGMALHAAGSLRYVVLVVVFGLRWTLEIVLLIQSLIYLELSGSLRLR